MKFTDTSISTLTGTSAIIQCPTFKGLRFELSGGLKKFVLHRCYKGKRIYRVLGHYPAIKCDHAVLLATNIIYGNKSIDKKPVKKLHEVITEFFIEHPENGTTTKRNRDATFNKLAKLYNNPIDSITTTDLFKAIHVTKIQNSTYSSYKNIFCLLFNFAIRKSYITDNPATHLMSVKVKSTKIRYFTTKELILILAAIPDANIKLLILFLVTTGLRISDALALKSKDIDMDLKAIRFTAKKNTNVQVIPLSDYMLNLLTQLPDPIFPYTYKIIRYRFKRAVEDTGIPKGTLHDLRRTLASRMAINGTDSNMIAEVLGHSNLANVKVYAKLNLDAMRDALSAVTSELTSPPSSSLNLH